MDRSVAFNRELVSLLARLRRFAHALSRNAADADDLTQATIERALRSRSQWREGTRLDSWAYRIMRNLWIDTARARARRQKIEAPAEDAMEVAAGPADAMDSALELSRMMAAMERLPDEQREVVALILIEGFGYRETAEMLDIPMGTVASRLVRGRSALLELVGVERAE